MTLGQQSSGSFKLEDEVSPKPTSQIRDGNRELTNWLRGPRHISLSAHRLGCKKASPKHWPPCPLPHPLWSCSEYQALTYPLFTSPRWFQSKGKQLSSPASGKEGGESRAVVSSTSGRAWPASQPVQGHNQSSLLAR